MGIQRLNNEIPKYFASKLFQKAIIQKPYELMIFHYFLSYIRIMLKLMTLLILLKIFLSLHFPFGHKIQ